MESISNGSLLAFQLAAVEAQTLTSNVIESEHLFLGLCKVNVFTDLPIEHNLFQKINRNDLLDEIEVLNAIMRKCAFVPGKAGRRLSYLLADAQGEPGIFSGHRSERCRHVFRVASEIAADFGWQEIRLHHLLDAILLQESDILDKLFLAMRVERKDMLTFKKLSDGELHRLQGEKNNHQDNPENSPSKPNIQESQPDTPFLNANARDITGLMKQGKLAPVIGRRQEIKKIARILAQKNKNNPLLIGEPGVGKTCLIEGLAQLIVSPDAPALLKDLRIVEISLGNLVAGTKYRGEFEEKLTTVLKEAASDPKLVLFIDEMHTLVSAGAAEGALSAGNIMKPVLARGEIKCIGATTTREYHRYLEKDPALQRRFQVVWVDEPSPEESVAILKGLAPHFQKHFGMLVPDKVMERAVELAVRYLPELRLPDKAIDLIDQACATAMIGTISPGHKQAPAELSVKFVTQVLSERCRIPLEELTTEESDRLMHMEEYLNLRVKGQDQAVREISEAVRVARVGLKDPQRPSGVFFLAGPTGTGKTELARALAAFLFHDEKRLLRFDMSEYQEKHNVSRLIGAPPGYAGYGEEGQLTGSVRNNPYSVILFDEIEKAHPDVFDIFLQILDAGRLTDGHGRMVNFSESIVIFTSNLGASSLSNDQYKNKIGFIADDGETEIDQPSLAESTVTNSYKAKILQSINTQFKPEFINRLGRVVVFSPLTQEAVRKILDKIISEANWRLAEKEIRLVMDESAREFIVKKGYSKKFGARELERSFAHYVNEPLARMILNGDIHPPQVVELSSDGESIIFIPSYGITF